MTNTSSIKKSNVLVSALDWGFGHTTRVGVVIKQLLDYDNKVTFAGNSNQISYIKKEFTEVKCVFLKGYGITLDSRKNTYLQLLKQLVKFRLAIRKEHHWLKKTCKSNSFDYIISDNRYGFYNTKVKSIFITHQINLSVSFGRKIANSFIKRRVNKFSFCWIPDYSDHQLSGALSKEDLNIPKYFIGPLSRFELKQTSDKKNDYLFLISGPFPENSTLYQKVISFVEKYQLSAVIAIPFKKKTKAESEFYRLVEEPTSEELEVLINQSKTIVARSGYTTIMDLIPFKKPVILIPTKGQFEQEYLWKLHQSKFVKNGISRKAVKEIS